MFLSNNINSTYIEISHCKLMQQLQEALLNDLSRRICQPKDHHHDLLHISSQLEAAPDQDHDVRNREVSDHKFNKTYIGSSSSPAFPPIEF